MTEARFILVDTGILVAFYDADDPAHGKICQFLSTCKSQLVTTVGCITEVMWLLAPHWQVQNEFLRHVAQGIYRCEPLLKEDFERILELNTQYADLPGDFSDLALVAISKRLNIPAIATLDKDFDIYRRYRNQPFDRIVYP